MGQVSVGLLNYFSVLTTFVPRYFLLRRLDDFCLPSAGFLTFGEKFSYIPFSVFFSTMEQVYLTVGWFAFPPAGLQDLNIEPPAKTETCHVPKDEGILHDEIQFETA